LAGDLFELSNRAIDEKALIIYITSDSVELMDKDELDMLQKYADQGMKIVFVVSGDLGQGSKESLLKIVEEPNRIIYLDVDGNSDGSIPTALLSKGNCYSIQFVNMNTRDAICFFYGRNMQVYLRHLTNNSTNM